MAFTQNSTSPFKLLFWIAVVIIIALLIWLGVTWPKPSTGQNNPESGNLGGPCLANNKCNNDLICKSINGEKKCTHTTDEDIKLGNIDSNLTGPTPTPSSTISPTPTSTAVAEESISEDPLTDIITGPYVDGIYYPQIYPWQYTDYWGYSNCNGNYCGGRRHRPRHETQDQIVNQNVVVNTDSNDQSEQPLPTQPPISSSAPTSVSTLPVTTNTELRNIPLQSDNKDSSLVMPSTLQQPSQNVVNNSKKINNDRLVKSQTRMARKEAQVISKNNKREQRAINKFEKKQLHKARKVQKTAQRDFKRDQKQQQKELIDHSISLENDIARAASPPKIASPLPMRSKPKKKSRSPPRT